MRPFLSEIRKALLATLILAVVCCGLYPLLVFGLAQALFPEKANGSLIRDARGTILGSRLLGQPFSGDEFFQPRPSAAGNGYDACGSGGGNLGPTSRKLHDLIARNVSDYRARNGLRTNTPVPADAVTASGSGLDPHISPQNAELQVARVAKVRGLSAEAVRDLVRENTAAPHLGFLGDAGVNVLTLNLALDQIKPAHGATHATHEISDFVLLRMDRRIQDEVAAFRYPKAFPGGTLCPRPADPRRGLRTE